MIGNELFNMKKSLLFGAAMLLCACTNPATAKEGLVPFEVAERGCLAEALLFEAGNQPLIGMIAVGEVIINRIASDKYPDTVCDVVHEGPISRWHYKELNKKVPIKHRCQFSYYCDGKSDDIKDFERTETYEKVVRAVIYILDILNTGKSKVRIVDGATHYHADYVTPNWSKHLERIVQIEDHIFYK